jgi:hypothetical protein
MNKLHMTLVNNTPSAHVSPSLLQTKIHTHTKQRAKLVPYALIFILGQQTERQKTVYRMAACILFAQSALNLF